MGLNLTAHRLDCTAREPRHIRQNVVATDVPDEAFHFLYVCCSTQGIVALGWRHAEPW
ncbi:hypothetical protein SDC9_76116 [bioreactor metagenome]|uniref:Uncharacterized protein n=1 Tax=bioreactor metagenome TaxID=1076179 RepID=A0A644YM44_9ZZZZ